METLGEDGVDEVVFQVESREFADEKEDVPGDGGEPIVVQVKHLEARDAGPLLLTQTPDGIPGQIQTDQFVVLGKRRVDDLCEMIRSQI